MRHCTLGQRTLSPPLLPISSTRTRNLCSMFCKRRGFEEMQTPWLTSSRINFSACTDQKNRILWNHTTSTKDLHSVHADWAAPVVRCTEELPSRISKQLPAWPKSTDSITVKAAWLTKIEFDAILWLGNLQNWCWTLFFDVFDVCKRRCNLAMNGYDDSWISYSPPPLLRRNCRKPVFIWMYLNVAWYFHFNGGQGLQ